MRTLRADAVARALQQHGLTGSALADRLGVSRQTVSNWLKGRDTPRPDKLLRLSLALKLSLKELLEPEVNVREPVVAYRMTANRRVKDEHLANAREMGEALDLLVPYLPYNSLVAPPQLRDPEADYRYVQAAAASLRSELGLKDDDRIWFDHLIGHFQKLQSVIVPVLWGKRDSHANALHIYLPHKGSTWIYLNLDTNEFDFMFWMAHELAHAYTSALCGKDEGEDFADMFASALLFPETCAKSAYETLSSAVGAKALLDAIVGQALERHINVYTVFKQTNAYAQHKGLKPIALEAGALHGTRHRIGAVTKTIREILFDDDGEPAPREYIAGCEKAFETPVFKALSAHIRATGAEAGFVQHVLGIRFADAKALHTELRA